MDLPLETQWGPKLTCGRAHGQHCGDHRCSTCSFCSPLRPPPAPQAPPVVWQKALGDPMSTLPEQVAAANAAAMASSAASTVEAGAGLQCQNWCNPKHCVRDHFDTRCAGCPDCQSKGASPAEQQQREHWELRLQEAFKQGVVQ